MLPIFFPEDLGAFDCSVFFFTEQGGNAVHFSGRNFGMKTSHTLSLVTAGEMLPNFFQEDFGGAGASTIFF